MASIREEIDAEKQRLSEYINNKIDEGTLILDEFDNIVMNDEIFREYSIVKLSSYGYGYHYGVKIKNDRYVINICSTKMTMYTEEGRNILDRDVTVFQEFDSYILYFRSYFHNKGKITEYFETARDAAIHLAKVLQKADTESGVFLHYLDIDYLEKKEKSEPDKAVLKYLDRGWGDFKFFLILGGLPILLWLISGLFS